MKPNFKKKYNKKSYAYKGKVIKNKTLELLTI